MPSRNAEPDHDPRDRFGLYRLCNCPTCGGKGKEPYWAEIEQRYVGGKRCPDCRGEGRIRQEVASCETPEAVGVALVTLAREGEWEECPFGLLDRTPECEACGGSGRQRNWADHSETRECPGCFGSGVKPTGTWLVSPWLPSARNVSDAGRVLARSKRTSRTQ